MNLTIMYYRGREFLFLCVLLCFSQISAGPSEYILEEPSIEVREFLARKIKPRTRSIYSRQLR